MSDQQADNGGGTSYKVHADQCTETATKNECRFAGKRTDQPRCVIGMRRDLVSLCPDWRATGQSAAVVRDHSKIAGKLIGEGFRAVCVTSAALEDQQYRARASDRVVKVYFGCFELRSDHIRFPDVRMPDIMGRVKKNDQTCIQADYGPLAPDSRRDEACDRRGPSEQPLDRRASQ